MDKGKMRSNLYRVIIYLLSLMMMIISLFDKTIENSDIKLYVIFLIGTIVLGLFAVNSGKALIDLSDSAIAFIFISFGRKEAVLFGIIYWIVMGIINKTVYHRHHKGVLFNICMTAIETFLTATILMKVREYIVSNTLIDSVLFVGIFLSINVFLYKLDTAVQEGKFERLNAETKKLLLNNFVLSSMFCAIFIIISKNSSYIGIGIVVIILVIAFHFYFLYRKLKFRSRCIKQLIKVTSDVVKYGDFNEKCSHLLHNLRELIPYEVCAIYTFDSENDNLVYPISYVAPKDIRIGDLDVNTSKNAITTKVIKEGKIYISKDFKKDKKIKAKGKLYDITEVAVIVPIMSGDQAVGFMSICGRRDLGLFVDNGVEDILAILSNQMALAIENDSIYRSMRDEADIDFLTNLFNRRSFERKINELISTNTMFSMVIYDIDDFKNVNDAYGHLVGDEALKNVCSIIKKSIRKTDIACRYGGEELVILFNNLSKDDAYIISDRIRNKIKQSPITCNELEINITVSGGISSFPEDGSTKEEIISYADELLYNECKNKGKDKVCAYRPLDN